ncbi:MAG: hypothetical protein U0457_12680 [Candidatus Sericytochromatia bacterium]
MTTSIIRTFREKNNSDLSEKKLCSVFAKYFANKFLPKNKITNTEISKFWNILITGKNNKSQEYKNYCFDRTYLDKNKNLEYTLDIEILDDWYSKIKNIDDLKKEISIDQSKKILLRDILERDFTWSFLFNSIIDKLNFRLNNNDKTKEEEDYDETFNRIAIFLEEIEVIFKTLKEDFIKNNFKELLNKNELNFSDIVENSDIKLLESGIDFLEFLEKKAGDIELIDNNNNNIKVLEKGNITFNLDNFMDKKRFYLKGESGSGKTFISLIIAKLFLKENYHVYFLNCKKSNLINEIEEIINDNNNKLIIFDNFDKLDKKTRKDIYDNEKFKSSDYFLYTVSKNSENYSEIEKYFKNKPLNKLEIKPLEHEKEWVKTVLDREIYEKYKNKLNSNYEIYSEYLKDLIKNYCEDYDLTYLELSNFLKKLAFNSLLGEVSFEENLSQNSSLNNFLKNNKITFVSNIPEKIYFVHERFRDILAVEYLLSELSDIEDINFILEKEILKTNKWKYFLSYYAYRINKTNFEKLYQYESIISPLLDTLLSLRYFDEHIKILDLINPKKVEPEKLRDIYFHQAKNYYNKEGDYINSLKYAIKAYEIDINFNSESISDIFNHFLSCCVDLFLPEVGLNIFEKAFSLEKITEKQKANLLGNKARILLKKGEYNEAFNTFSEKNKLYLKLDLEIDLKEEELRNKSDLILSYAFLNKNIVSKENYSEAIKLFEEIKNSYEELEKKTNLDYSNKKSFIYRNLSYFLNTNIEENIKEEILAKLADFEELNKKDSSAEGGYYLNLGKYYYYKNDYEKAEKNFLISKKILEDFNYIAELYICYAYLYFIKKDENYKKQSIDNYNKIKNISFESLKLIKSFYDEKKENFCLKNIFDDNMDKNYLIDLFLI